MHRATGWYLLFQSQVLECSRSRNFRQWFAVFQLLHNDLYGFIQLLVLSHLFFYRVHCQSGISGSTPWFSTIHWPVLASKLVRRERVRPYRPYKAADHWFRQCRPKSGYRLLYRFCLLWNSKGTSHRPKPNTYWLAILSVLPVWHRE